MIEDYTYPEFEGRCRLYAPHGSSKPTVQSPVKPTVAPQSTPAPSLEARWARIMARKSQKAQVPTPSITAEIAQCEATIAPLAEETPAIENDIALQQALDLAEQLEAMHDPAPIEWIVDEETLQKIAQDIVDGLNGSLSHREYYAGMVNVRPSDLGNAAVYPSPMNRLQKAIYHIRKASKKSSPPSPAAKPLPKELDLSEIL